MLRSGQVVKKDLCGKNNFIKSVTRILKTWWSASPWPWQLELNWHLSSISQSCLLVIAQYCLCFLSYDHHLWFILEWAVAYNTNTTAVLWPAPRGTTEVRRELEDRIVHAALQGKGKEKTTTTTNRGLATQFFFVVYDPAKNNNETYFIVCSFEWMTACMDSWTRWS